MLSQHEALTERIIGLAIEVRRRRRSNRSESLLLEALPAFLHSLFRLSAILAD
jgi:hypothetical protein